MESLQASAVFPGASNYCDDAIEEERDREKAAMGTIAFGIIIIAVVAGLFVGFVSAIVTAICRCGFWPSLGWNVLALSLAFLLAAASLRKETLFRELLPVLAIGLFPPGILCYLLSCGAWAGLKSLASIFFH